jgi:hypothetical protein
MFRYFILRDLINPNATVFVEGFILPRAGGVRATKMTVSISDDWIY